MEQILVYQAAPQFDHVAARDAVSETLDLTRAFVAILLAERPGALTAIQRDFLETIAGKIDRLQLANADHAPSAGAWVAGVNWSMRAPLSPYWKSEGSAMVSNPSSSGHAEPSPDVQDQIHLSDPHAYLRPQMRVKGEQGKWLGKVDAVERDATGVLTGITVRHGLLNRKCTRVPVERIKQVNDDAVVIEFNATRFNRLPRLAKP